MKSEIIGNFEISDIGGFFEYYIGKNIPINNKRVFVEIYGDEGKNIPHIHVYTTDHSIDAPIRLYSCGYFLHGKHSSPLPNGGAKILDTWFRKTSIKDNEKTNWEYADWLWCELYDNSKRFTNIQPDYSKLDMPLKDSPITVDIDLKITDKNLFKINNDYIKLGFSNDVPCIVIMGPVKDNSKSIPCILKYIWYHKDIGDTINICVHKNNTIKYNTRDIERLVKNMISSELFDINSESNKYVELDFFKIGNKK